MQINYTNKLIKNDYDTMLPNYVKNFIESKVNNVIFIKIYKQRNNKIIIDYEDVNDNIKQIEYDKERNTISFNDSDKSIEETYGLNNGKYSLINKTFFYSNNNNYLIRNYNTNDGYFKYILNANGEIYNILIGYFRTNLEVDSLKDINKSIMSEFYKSYHDPEYSDIYGKYADDIMEIVFNGNIHFDNLYELYEHIKEYLCLDKASLNIKKDNNNLIIYRNNIYSYNEYFIKDGIKYHVYKKNIQSNEPVFYVEEVMDKEIGSIEDTKEFIKKIRR